MKAIQRGNGKIGRRKDKELEREREREGERLVFQELTFWEACRRR